MLPSNENSPRRAGYWRHRAFAAVQLAQPVTIPEPHAVSSRRFKARRKNSAMKQQASP